MQSTLQSYTGGVLQKTDNGIPERPPNGNSAYDGVEQDEDLFKEPSQKMSEMARRSLGSYIDNVFSINKNLRESNGIEEDLLKRLRQMNGEYNPKDLAEIRAKGQPEVYINLSAHKQRTLVAWLDEFYADTNKTFVVNPTPVPELDEVSMNDIARKVMDEAAKSYLSTGELPQGDQVYDYAQKLRSTVEDSITERAKNASVKMQKRIKDDFVEGKFSETGEDFRSLLATYGTAAIRGPVLRRKKLPRYAKTRFGKKVELKSVLVREFDAISPWDMFPGTGATDAQNGDFCLRVRYSPRELRHLCKIPCYFENEILAVLAFNGTTGVKVEVSSDSERVRLEKKLNYMHDETKTLEGVEMWGEVPGDLLIGKAITRTPDGKPIKADEWYSVNAIVIDSHVIYCRVMDSDEDRNIEVGHVYRKPGSFWGEGPLHVMDHIQRVCNATCRSLLVNMGFASGPQGVISDFNRLHPTDDARARPNKMWAFYNNGGNQSEKPLSFFDIPSISNELINVFTFFMRLADEITGIPAYANGTDAAVGAARTATGLNMLFGAANRGIKKIIGNVDKVNKACVERDYWWHMMYTNDDSIKGDINVEVLGVKQFNLRESQAQKNLELLKTVSQDPTVAQIQSPLEKAKMLREIAIGFDIDPDALAPPEDEMKKRIAQASAQAQQQMQAQGQQKGAA